MRATVCTGSVISSPNTGSVAAAVTTTSSENTRKFTGRPRKLPFLTASKTLAVAGEVAEVEHRAGEVGHHQRDRAEHHRHDVQPVSVTLAEVEVDVRPAGLADQVAASMNITT